MLVAVGLALVSLILIYFEFFSSKLILGILGGLAFCLSIFLFILESGDIWPIVIFIIASILCLILTIRVALWKRRR